MDFDLSEEQILLQKSAGQFFKRECPSKKVREIMGTETAFDEKLWTSMADQGYQGLLLADKYGGLELGLVELVIISEELGKACIPGPFISNLWGTCLLDLSNNEGQKTKYLKNIAEGKTKLAVAYLEEDGDWDASRIQLQAKSEGEGLILSGEKHQVMDAGSADLMIVVARDSSKKLVLALVPTTASGLALTKTPAMDTTRPVFKAGFNGVKVAAADILASGAEAESALAQATSIATLAASADLVGGIQWTMETSVEYAKTRKQFDTPIGVFQAIQHKCADMFLKVESSRSAVLYAAWSLGESEPDSQRALSMAKSYCSEASYEIGSNGIQIHGGIGMTWEHDLHLYYKRAKASELLFGDATYHRERIAKIMISK